MSFRNADKYGLDPMRDWIRRECPSAGDGFVPIDIDMAVRTYGENLGSDSDGMLMFVEKKENGGSVTGGQRMTYRWMERAMSNSDYKDRWRGCHVLEVLYQDQWPVCDTCGQAVRVDPERSYLMFAGAELRWDGQPITHDDLKQKLLGP